MEIVLEVERSNGQRSWHVLTDLPLTIGRGLANDVILDDAYADANHVRITRDELGSYTVEDRGSVNGMLVGVVRHRERATVSVGSELTIGRTVLRFRDRDEALAPALVNDQAMSHVRQTDAARIPKALDHSSAIVRATIGWRWRVIVALAAAAYGLTTWMANTQRSSAGAVFGSVMTLLLILAAWAGAWAIASRVTVQRFNFSGHMAVVAAVSLCVLLIATLAEWMTFLFANTWLSGALIGGSSIVLVGVAIIGHLTFASTMTLPRRVRIGAWVGVVLLSLISISALTDEDEFSDVPAYASVLKPLAPRWIPTSSISEFGDGIKALRAQTDSLVVAPAADAAVRK